jgi:hypothetical protein
MIKDFFSLSCKLKKKKKKEVVIIRDLTYSL